MNFINDLNGKNCFPQSASFLLNRGFLTPLKQEFCRFMTKFLLYEKYSLPPLIRFEQLILQGLLDKLHLLTRASIISLSLSALCVFVRPISGGGGGGGSNNSSPQFYQGLPLDSLRKGIVLCPHKFNFLFLFELLDN